MTTTNYGFVIDNRRCIGCHACTVACKSEHSDPIGVNKTWVSYVEKGIFPETTREFHVMRCNHCADAPCVDICPTACLNTRGDGIVDFDPGRCIGCKACMQACPYDAIMIHPDTGTATKCNYCSHRVDQGREPACVVVCPADAIVAGDLSDPSSKIAGIVAREDVSVRKPEKRTRPKLYYVNGDAAALDPSGAATSTRTLWGEKSPDGLVATGDATPITTAERAAPKRTYDIAQRHAGSWGWMVSAYLFTKSIAAGVFLVAALSLFFGNDAVSGSFFAFAAPVALAMLAATGALLVADLKRPTRFLWVLLRPQWKSWLVRGAYIITAYGGLLTMWYFVMPDVADPLTQIAAAIGGVLAAGTACYSGWLFGQAKGRDFWQSSLVPLHLLVQALVAGCATQLLWTGMKEQHAVFATPLLVLLVVNVLIILQEVWGHHATADAGRAAKLMRSGTRGAFLVRGCLLLGHIAPIALLVVFANSSGAADWMLYLSGFLSLVGLLIYEHLWIDAPQRLPLA